MKRLLARLVVLGVQDVAPPQIVELGSVGEPDPHESVVLVFLVLLLCCIWCCICFLCLLMRRRRRREKLYQGEMVAAELPAVACLAGENLFPFLQQ